MTDIGAASGQVTYDWFEIMYSDVAEAHIAFTAVGVVTANPASVENVLGWAKRLQHRVRYVIVENSLTDHSDFTFLRDTKQALQFQEVFKPAVIRMNCRLADLENAARTYGATLGDIAARRTNGIELQKASLVMRAQSYRRRIFAEFERVAEVLLP